MPAAFTNIRRAIPQRDNLKYVVGPCSADIAALIETCFYPHFKEELFGRTSAVATYCGDNNDHRGCRILIGVNSS